MGSPRKNAPALYELIGRGSRLSHTHRPDHDPDRDHDRPEPEETHAAIGPGRVVRMPIGFFFFGVAIVLAAGVGGYMLGYQVRDGEADREARDRAAAEVAGLREPIGGDRTNPEVISPTRLGAQRQPARTPTDPPPVATRPPADPPRADPSVVLVDRGTPDPRRTGENYPIIARLGRDRAMEVAEFLVDRGLEIAVVAPHNGTLYTVVGLRGFPSGEFRSEARRSLDRSIRALGEEWARSGRGRDGFDDLYWERYD